MSSINIFLARVLTVKDLAEDCVELEFAERVTISPGDGRLTVGQHISVPI